MKNPFRPTAGATPSEIIGRAGILDEFDYGLGIGSGAPGLLTIFTGARGIGKTVMLGAAQGMAREHSWAVISETATVGFIGRIGESMRRMHEDLCDGPKVSGVNTPLPPERQLAWRTTGENLLRLLNERGTGLVITVDEIQAADRDELAQIAATVQHFIRERLPIALVLAGLPAGVSALLNEGPATFLRRADRIVLTNVAVSDVEKSFAGTFTEAGFAVAPDFVRRAADSTGGYPFLVQLVGYFLWREAENDAALTAAAVDRAIERAYKWNARTVVASALAAASTKDVEFLRAMSEDDGPSTTGDIGRRMGVKQGMVSNYCTRLMAAGLIEATGDGRIDFAIPGFRRHLRSTPQQ